MNVAAHQKESKNTRERQENRRNRRLILKRVSAALLRSFREQYGKKNDLIRGAPGVTGTIGKAKSHFDPTQMRSGTAPPR